MFELDWGSLQGSHIMSTGPLAIVMVAHIKIHAQIRVHVCTWWAHA